jgi:hypothetical protein
MHLLVHVNSYIDNVLRNAVQFWVVNRLSTERRARILSMMVEGVSLRAISRLTGAGTNTLARLLTEFGVVCATYHNRAVRNVRVRHLQCDEVWSFIGKKAKNTMRITRLTDCFSKEIDNHIAAVAIFFMHYNFCRVHQTLRITPAMAAGLTDHVWSVEEVCNLAQNPVSSCRQIERMMVAKALGESTSMGNRYEA